RMQNELLRIWEQERITMILVTHDVDEAVYLGDRVVTMAPRPGRIERIVDVALSRPRRRDSPEFARLRATVLADFDDGGDDDRPGGTPARADAPHARRIGAWRLAW
ncbi:sulfonate/nitrate/taurine transport system ATP-binding protein, partial [Burkholderia sp. TJI49]